MTSNTSNNDTSTNNTDSTDNNGADGNGNGAHVSSVSDQFSDQASDQLSDRSWSQVAASHRQVQRVEDTLEVAHECMRQVEVGFLTGTYTAHDVLTLGPVLLAWADQLHGELATLRQQHQAFVDAWLNISTSSADDISETDAATGAGSGEMPAA